MGGRDRISINFKKAELGDTMKYRNSLFFWIIPSFVPLLQLTRSDCEFPRQWWGRWHQPLIGDVIIRSNDISTKGTCYEQYRDYFLVENRREHCYQCLLILRRHMNLIQYRESYCIGREALQSICNQMRVDRFGSVHTIIRDGALPVSCPLLKAFHFTYNNQSGGFCRSPTSYAHQCASPTMLRFNFRHCRHCLNAFDRDLEFDCLATWKDGVDHFVYGQFLDAEFDRGDVSYRCFVYQKMGTVVNMAVSSDATCRGVRSPKEGPLVIEMTEDVYGWPSARCTFPSSLNGTTWFEISGRVSFAFNSANDVTTIHTQRKHSSIATAHAPATIKCLKTDRQPRHASSDTSVSGDDDDELSRHISDSGNVTILAHVLEKCQSRHRCFRIQRRHIQLLHVFAGNYVRDAKSSCTDDDFSSDHTQHFLLTAAHHDHRGSKCPLRGRYAPLRDETGNCQPELRIGCIQPDQLHVISTCQTDEPLLQLVCQFWWREHPSVFLVARRMDNNQSQCYHFQHHHSHFTMDASEHCSQFDNRDKGFSVPFVFQPVREKCKEYAIRPEMEPSMKKVVVSDPSNDIDPDPSIKILLAKEMPSKREQQMPSRHSLNNSALLSSSHLFIAASFVASFSILRVKHHLLGTFDFDGYLYSVFYSLLLRNTIHGTGVMTSDDIRFRSWSCSATHVH